MKSSDFSGIDRPATAPVYLLKTHQYTPDESCCDDLKELRVNAKSMYTSLFHQEEIQIHCSWGQL